MAKSSIDQDPGKIGKITRASLAVGAISLISNIDYPAAIAGAEYAQRATSLNDWLIAGGAMAGVTLESYASTYIATSGLRDVSWTPKSRLGQFVCKFSPAVTAWRGAASGVFIDRLRGHEISQSRRVAHASLYGACVAFWTTPLPIAQQVTDMGANVLDIAKNWAVNAPDFAVAHPVQSAVGVAVTGIATAIGLRRRAQ